MQTTKFERLDVRVIQNDSRHRHSREQVLAARVRDEQRRDLVRTKSCRRPRPAQPIVWL